MDILFLITHIKLQLSGFPIYGSKLWGFARPPLSRPLPENHKGGTMTRILKQAAWLIAATILLGGLSFAQGRDDDGYYDSNHQWHDRRDRDDRYRDDRRQQDWQYQNRTWPDDRRDGYYRGDPGGYGYRGGSYDNGPYGRDNRGFTFGFQDGAYVAREDMALGKPYHPEVRGKYRDADRGYDRYWGDKREYRAQYAEGYRRGYMRAFRSRY
jgi:hypothetical protein